MSWCHPDKRTDNPHGRCCVFPFVYGGKTYNSCTKVAHHIFWCSLDKVYKGHWANCVNPCTNNPCQNGGVCTVTGDDSYSCKCAEGFYGNNCEKGLRCPPGKKTDNPHGRCCVFPFVYGGKKYKSCTTVAHHRLWCSLDKVYKGHWANCASPCKSLPCKNGGTCTMSGPDSFFCTCTDEFKGETCEKRLPCPSGKKTDNPHGRCCVFPFVYGGKKYESCTKVAHNRLWCSLDKIYKGHWANCVNPCTNNPCQNGGVCTVTGDDSYSCKCAEGYCGKSCEKAVEWKSEGCYKEHNRARKMVLGYKFATVQRKKRKIKEVFDICKVAAEKKGYKIFGIRNMKGCFTTSDGEVHNFKKYGTSSNCKVDYNGLGVGKKLANFVFTRL
ncbi:neurogenic locus Notch protein-like isoform X3 [Stylophora pistillata]|uniref:neurogenic locus Notch protein-like isoform X3 n=1 Tax=Stylophora pistillata TaxID=50429 RepID=UPI000C04CE91|nr:neurogenic locus Notch protein-like isoform X3 [Stylophora pistillata]